MIQSIISNYYNQTPSLKLNNYLSKPSCLHSSSKKVGNVVVLVVFVVILKSGVESGIVGVIRIQVWVHEGLQFFVETGDLRYKCWIRTQYSGFSDKNKN